MTKEELIDLVLVQIVADVNVGDLSAIEELLKVVPTKNLEAYLSEEAEL